MNRRFFKSLSLWIVPLLIARAMIPAGFMLSAGADGLELMFCSGSMQMPAAMQSAGEHGEHAAHHHTNDQSGGNHQSGGGNHDNAPCPFSLAAFAVSVDVPYLAAAALVAADEIVAFNPVAIASASSLRLDRIRGPPFFS